MQYTLDSSIDIHSSRELHTTAKANHIAMLDAPASGGVLAAQNATLTFNITDSILMNLKKRA